MHLSTVTLSDINVTALTLCFSFHGHRSLSLLQAKYYRSKYFELCRINTLLKNRLQYNDFIMLVVTFYDPQKTQSPMTISTRIKSRIFWENKNVYITVIIRWYSTIFIYPGGRGESVIGAPQWRLPSLRTFCDSNPVPVGDYRPVMIIFLSFYNNLSRKRPLYPYAVCGN